VEKKAPAMQIVPRGRRNKPSIIDHPVVVIIIALAMFAVAAIEGANAGQRAEQRLAARYAK
jgi:hypothetical protein